MDTGLCACDVGYVGERCEVALETCIDDDEPCGGERAGNCDYDTGLCMCLDGYSGENCEIADFNCVNTAEADR
jgi:hypothetical protein